MATYVTADGSYGGALGMVVVDTSKWTDDDWDELDLAANRDSGEGAPAVAMAIAMKYSGGE